jgi:hypothetical protein
MKRTIPQTGAEATRGMSDYDRLDDAYKTLLEWRADDAQKLRAQAERIKELEVNLLEWGTHLPNCRHIASGPRRMFRCNCGLHDMLLGLGLLTPAEPLAGADER